MWLITPRSAGTFKDDGGNTTIDATGTIPSLCVAQADASNPSGCSLTIDTFNRSVSAQSTVNTITLRALSTAAVGTVLGHKSSFGNSVQWHDADLSCMYGVATSRARSANFHDYRWHPRMERREICGCEFYQTFQTHRRGKLSRRHRFPCEYYARQFTRRQCDRRDSRRRSDIRNALQRSRHSDSSLYLWPEWSHRHSHRRNRPHLSRHLYLRWHHNHSCAV